MKKYSINYIRKHHPLKVRLVALWRVLTCRNIILIDLVEIHDIEKGKGMRVRPLYRTDYDKESEVLTLKCAISMKKSADA